MRIYRHIILGLVLAFFLSGQTAVWGKGETDGATAATGEPVLVQEPILAPDAMSEEDAEAAAEEEETLDHVYVAVADRSAVEDMALVSPSAEGIENSVPLTAAEQKENAGKLKAMFSRIPVLSNLVKSLGDGWQSRVRVNPKFFQSIGRDQAFNVAGVILTTPWHADKLMMVWVPIAMGRGAMVWISAPTSKDSGPKGPGGMKEFAKAYKTKFVRALVVGLGVGALAGTLQVLGNHPENVDITLAVMGIGEKAALMGGFMSVTGLPRYSALAWMDNNLKRFMGPRLQKITLLAGNGLNSVFSAKYYRAALEALGLDKGPFDLRPTCSAIFRWISGVF